MEIKSYLNRLGIKFETYTHPALKTVEDGQKHKVMLKSPINKSLFLKGKKSNKFFMVVLRGEKRLDLKQIETLLNEKLRFASEEDLKNILELYPGAVSPFGLVNDKNSEVELLIDEESLQSELISFHPNNNTETLELTMQDFKKYLESLRNKKIVFN